jgi:hypothetical protein
MKGAVVSAVITSDRHPIALRVIDCGLGVAVGLLAAKMRAHGLWVRASVCGTSRILL